MSSQDTHSTAGVDYPQLGILAKGREARETGEDYQLREPAESYLPHFKAEKSDIGGKNAYL